MANLPYRPCPGRGGSCPNLIRGGQTLCPECMVYEKKNIREYDKKRDELPGRKFLHSTQWRKIREIKLSLNPLCQICEDKGLIVPAIIIHHIDGNELNNDMDNLMSVCRSCHEQIHKGDRWGR